VLLGIYYRRNPEVSWVFGAVAHLLSAVFVCGWIFWAVWGKDEKKGKVAELKKKKEDLEDAAAIL